jgi:hypothetical protein
MVRASLVALVVLLVACGGSSNPAPKGPDAASVSVQPGDVPHGMVRCELSGDINAFIQKERSAAQGPSNSASSEWADAQKNGATSAYVAIYTDNAAQCAAIKSNETNISAAAYRLVVNFVVEFKDEASAVKTYTTGSIFNESASSLRSSQSQAIEGTKTGLTANSVAVSETIANQTFYIALWQNKAFVVYLVTLNLTPAASQKVATSVNGRIS